MKEPDVYTVLTPDYRVSVSTSYVDCWDDVNNRTETPFFDADHSRKVGKTTLKKALDSLEPVKLYNEGDPDWCLIVEKHE